MVIHPPSDLEVQQPGVQFNRHLKFKAWVKDEVKDVFRRHWIEKWLRLGLRPSKMSIELPPDVKILGNCGMSVCLYVCFSELRQR